MKKFYTLLLFLGLTLSALAQMPFKVAPDYQLQNTARKAPRKIIEGNIQMFPYMLGAFYTKLEDNVANYYVLLSSVRGEYDSTSGALTAPKGYVLFLDLYAAPNGGGSLPEGSYVPGTANQLNAFDSEYTCIQVMDENNNATEFIQITDTVTVSRTKTGQTLILTTATIGGKKKTLRFQGNIVLSNTQSTTDIYYQLAHDVNTRFTGGVSLYYGNLYDSNTGNMVVRMYDCQFDLESGAQLGDGYAMELMLFGPLFAEAKDAVIAPGHYTLARNFTRDTWFPGMEVNYMGVTVTFGTFVQELRSTDPTFGDEGYGWAYASSGTIDVEDIGGDSIRITLDLKSKTGYAIKGVYEGPQFPVFDYSPPAKSAVSTLTEDLELSLDYVERARIYDHGVQGETGTRSFVVDLGDDLDPEGFVLPELYRSEYGADCMRLEFLVAQNDPYLAEGIYYVTEENFVNYYAPGRMRWGYFANGGEITGTRWMHLAPSRYYVMDGHAPVVSGFVTVELAGKKSEDGADIYIFRINLTDDAGFNITGTWEGPVRLCYDPKEINPNAEGVSEILTPLAPVATYDLQGRSASAKSGIYLQKNRKLIR